MSGAPATRLLSTRPVVEDRPAAFRVGLIALATDLTSERDFARVCVPRNIAVHVSRIAYRNPTTAENLLAMQPDLGRAAALIAPGVPLDAIAYACTAASVLIGDPAIAAAIAEGRPDVPCITPIGGTAAGLRALGARRVAVLTPYTPDVAQPIADYLDGQGFRVVANGCLGFDDDRQMARIAPDSLVEAAAEVAGDDADALFISCTGLRAFEIVDRVETRIGRPVVTANQAMIWATLRAAGCRDPIGNGGRLMRLTDAVPA